MEADMGIMVEFDEEMLETAFATYLREMLKRVESYNADIFESKEEREEIKKAIVLIHNWIAVPSRWL
jgi:hypothetical protein